MDKADLLRWQAIVKTIKCAAFCFAIVLFALAGASVLTACQSYQPPGEKLWRVL